MRFSQQRLFENAWKELYPGMIERISLSQGGRVVSVDPATKTHRHRFRQLHRARSPTSFRRRRPAASPRSRAPPTTPAGARSIRSTFASKLVPNIHVIGDACIAGGIPKSASAANAEGKACAAVDRRACLPAKPPEAPTTDWRLLQHGRARLRVLASPASISRRTASSPRSTAASPARSMRRARSASARRTSAQAWFKTITVDAFG